MRRLPLILGTSVFALLSMAQYHLIGASLLSLAAWCVLSVSGWGSATHLENRDLFEYWLAGIVWAGTLIWLCRSLVIALRPNKAAPESSPEARQGIRHRSGWSARVLGLIGYIALISPFLMIVDPNAQGNLVTTRLLPPLSAGYVREYLDPGEETRSDGRVGQIFSQARATLLRRTMVMGTGPQVEARAPAPGGSVLIREFRTLFLFGTDDNARDVFFRVISGTRVSLGIGLSAALGALLIGCAIGFAAGMSGGVLDGVLMRVTDLFLAIPGLFLVIGILAFVGQSIPTIVVVLSLSGWMGIARIVRGEVISLREREFILAARLLRVSRWKIVTRHLLPNLRPVIVTAAVLQFANAILGEASLGFLGLGIQPPTATWGNMMGEAAGHLGSAWWMGLFPGVLLAAVLVTAHVFGEHPAVDGPTDALIRRGK